MQERVLSLSDPEARDPRTAGAKAAALAVAGAAGLPVLPGVVLPVAAARPVVSEASRVLTQQGSPSRARMAAMRITPPGRLLSDVRASVSGLPRPWIVRSSSPLEDDGVWSGAFSSFHGIGEGDLSTAIRGCWGSAYSPGVLDRADRCGIGPDHLGVAVLIQPEIQPQVGGTARLVGPEVEIVSTCGPLRGLMDGHVEGRLTRVGPDGTVAPSEGLYTSTAVEVARLVREVHRLLGHDAVEWARTGDDVHLLQSLGSGSRLAAPAAETEPVPDRVLAAPAAIRLARMLQARPGPLAHELVLPWAVALRGHLPETPPSSLDPVSAFARARAEAADLTAWVWQSSSVVDAAAEVGQVFGDLRGPAPERGLARLERLRVPPPDRVERILGMLETTRRALPGARGSVHRREAFWRMTPAAVARALDLGRWEVPDRFGVDDWEPFVHRVVSSAGQHQVGTPASPGAGAACAFLVDAEAGRTPSGRTVLVAPRPVPALAPLLWNAAALVTRAGTPAAHLIEFARSIGVPAVVGCTRLPGAHETRDALVAVDGTRGRVAVLPGQADDSLPIGTDAGSPTTEGGAPWA